MSMELKDVREGMKVWLLGPAGHALRGATGDVSRVMDPDWMWVHDPMTMLGDPFAWLTGQVLVSLDDPRPRDFKGRRWTPVVSVRPEDLAAAEGLAGAAEPDWALLRKADSVMFFALGREGWDSVARLEGAHHEKSGVRGWEALHELPNIGPRRILHLVNWLRGENVELSWFADFDACSASWSALEGQYRADPVPASGGGD